MALAYKRLDDEILQEQYKIWRDTSKFRWFLLYELYSVDVDGWTNKDYDRVVKIILDTSWH